METKYSFWIGIRKSAVRTLILAIPLLIMAVPQKIATLTVGFVLNLAYNFLKTKAGEAGLI